MVVHIIVDFMHIYYKYFFQMQSGRLRKLSYINEDGVEIDTSLIYYSIKDIEGIRKQMEGLGHDVTISVCFDSRSDRKDDNSEYKSKRVSRLNDQNISDLEIIQELLSKAGYNTYKIDGCEADDIAASLADDKDNRFQYSIIYTNDKDLLQSVSQKTGVMRFKQSKGYTPVDHNNFSEYVSNEMGVYIPYNMIGMYLATVGDSSDNVAGIRKFGKKAFSDFIPKVTKLANENGIRLEDCGKPEVLKGLALLTRGILNEEQFKQLIDSILLVARRTIELEAPINKSSIDKRQIAYCKYGMTSLI